MKRISRYLPLLLLSVGSIQLVSAQSLIDLNMGFGGISSGATGNGIEGDYTISNYIQPTNASLPQMGALCSIGSTSTSGLRTCTNGAKTNGLSGFVLGFGANLMLWKHFGVGLEATVQPGKPTYASIPTELNSAPPNPFYTSQYPVNSIFQDSYAYQSRTTLYDFNGIYQPVSTKRATLQVLGGMGGANTKLYTNQSASSLPVGSSTSALFGSSKHFQVHAGVGVQIYLSDHVYLRPQFDFHYVLSQQLFGKNILMGMVWLGYTFGDR